MSLDQQLKNLDAARGISDELVRQPRARQTLAAIMEATSVSESQRTRGSARRAARYAVAAGMVLLSGALVVDFAGGGTAYASWTPTARMGTPAEVARLGWDCMSHLSGHGYRVRLVEVRGRYGYTVLARDDGFEATCLAENPSGESVVMVSGFEGALTQLPAPDGLVTNSARSMSNDNGDVALEVTGKAGPDVVSVVFPTTMGDVRASLRDGYFAAWWPSDNSMIPSFGPPNPDVLVTLKDGTTRKARIQDFDVSPM